MLLKQILFFILLVVTQRVYSQTNEYFVLNAKIDSLPNSVYYINYEDQGVAIRDSVILDIDNSFKYSGRIKEPQFVYLRIKNNYNKRLAGDFDLCRFWVEPNKVTNIHVGGGWKTFTNIGWKPSYENAIFIINSSTTDSIYRIYQDYVNLQFVKWKEANKHDLNSEQYEQLQRGIMLRFLIEQPKTHFSLWLMDQLCKFEDADVAILDTLLQTFPVELKNTFRASVIREKLENKLALTVGKLLPNIILPDTSLKKIDLSTLRGKYVLIDFWASWCKPCRMEMPFLKQLYNKFNKKGFDIVSVSLDDNRDKWIEAVNNEDLKWIQLSDLSGVKSNLTRKFDITGIPDNFLIDAGGVIVARDIHGEPLNKLLEEIYSSVD